MIWKRLQWKITDYFANILQIIAHTKECLLLLCYVLILRDNHDRGHNPMSNYVIYRLSSSKLMDVGLAELLRTKMVWKSRGVFKWTTHPVLSISRRGWLRSRQCVLETHVIRQTPYEFITTDRIILHLECGFMLRSPPNLICVHGTD